MQTMRGEEPEVLASGEQIRILHELKILPGWFP